MLDLIKREIKIYFRNPSGIFMPILFFFLIVTIFPLSMSPDKNLLTLVIPTILWITSIFIIIFTTQNFFIDDYNSGVFESYYLSKISIEKIFFSKILSSFILFVFPLLFFIPLVIVFYDLNNAKSLIIFITVLVSMPSLFILSLFGVLITLGLSKQNYLSSIITLPFLCLILYFLPNLYSKLIHLFSTPRIIFLMAILILSLFLGPYLLAFTFKTSLQN
ncbi:MAG: heme exporter protein B [Thiotrichaceae bacterium]|nr:MAG: heme exporter protein B [Thiotrichaceae bacterium]